MANQLINYAHSLIIPLGKVEVIEEEERRTEESCNICQKGHTREYQVPASVGDLPLKARKTPSRDEVSIVILLLRR